MEIQFSWQKVEFNLPWKPYLKRVCDLFYSVIRSDFEQMSEAEGECSLLCQGALCVQEGALPWFHNLNSCTCILIKFALQTKTMIFR